MPNTDHGLASLDAVANLVAWFRAVTQNFPRPRFYWRADRKAGTLTVRVVDTPSQVTLWQASNPKARDFRLETIGPGWTSTPLTGTNGIYTATDGGPDGDQRLVTDFADQLPRRRSTLVLARRK